MVMIVAVVEYLRRKEIKVRDWHVTLLIHAAVCVISNFGTRL